MNNKLVLMKSQCIDRMCMQVYQNVRLLSCSSRVLRGSHPMLGCLLRNQNT